MKKIFETVTMEIVCLDTQDVVTASGSFAGNTYQDNELPLVPFSSDN